MKKLNLVAVQARVALADYADGAAFRRKIRDLLERAVDGLDPAHPTLVVYPEGIGLYLALVPFHYRRLAGAESLGQAAQALAPVLPALAWQMLVRRRFGAAVLALQHGVEAEAMYREAFAEAVAAAGVYCVAGSAMLPDVDHEPTGWRIVDRQVRSVSYLFGPRGLLLGRTHKVHMAPGLEQRLGLRAGAPSALQPVLTLLGRIGVLICMDGFYEALWARLDGLGAHVLCMPSYEMSRWEQPSWLRPGLKQGEQWLQDGMPRLLQGRENVRYGLNPMLVGNVLGLVAEGRSTICANVGATGAYTAEAIVAMAPEPDGEAMVRATVEASWL